MAFGFVASVFISKEELRLFGSFECKILRIVIK